VSRMFPPSRRAACRRSSTPSRSGSADASGAPRRTRGEKQRGPHEKRHVARPCRVS
jgi:hypothetical protein